MKARTGTIPRGVTTPNLRFLDEALEIARRERDVFAIRKPLMELLEWGHLFSDSIHTLVVALAMFAAAQGDVKQSIVGAIMYGRDKDSYASVAGALAGALNGVDAIPVAWLDPVIQANPQVDMRGYAQRLARLVEEDALRLQDEVTALQTLLE